MNQEDLSSDLSLRLDTLNPPAPNILRDYNDCSDCTHHKHVDLFEPRPPASASTRSRPRSHSFLRLGQLTHPGTCVKDCFECHHRKSSHTNELEDLTSPRGIKIFTMVDENESTWSQPKPVPPISKKFKPPGDSKSVSYGTAPARRMKRSIVENADQFAFDDSDSRLSISGLRRSHTRRASDPGVKRISQVQNPYLSRTASDRHNREDYQCIREVWISEQLKHFSSQYTEKQPVTVFIGTWNVQANKPDCDLSPWLAVDEPPDIYVLGLQEIIELKTSTVASSILSENAEHAQEWSTKLIHTLPEGYKLVGWKDMVGLLTFVFIRSSLQDHVSQVRFTTVPVGVMGIIGNKGAVAARLKVFDTTMCFVNSHLAAKQNHVELRNENYGTICTRIKFVNISDERRRKGRYEHFVKPEAGIFDHDVIFWLGDLNYRLNFNNEDVDYVHKLIKNKEIKCLLQHDQLYEQKTLHRVFHNFQEGKIDFLPSYKFVPGTRDSYDVRKQKIRIPSYCDRILWKAGDDEVSQILYDKVDDIIISDHKPVFGLFTIEAKRVIHKKLDKVVQKLHKKLDEFENLQKPQVQLSTVEVKFGDVYYDKPVTKTVQIENVGQVPAQYRFIPPPRTDRFCEPWLVVNPYCGIIMPGDTTTLTLSVHVTSKTAQSLINTKGEMEDILILGLDTGGDYFISVAGSYVSSCFGCSLNFLISVPKSIRDYDPSTSSPAKSLSVPKELWRLIDFIYKNGINETNLFEYDGKTACVQDIRECLDTGDDFPQDTDVRAMVQTLLKFLSHLPESVFPKALCRCADQNFPQSLSEALSELPAGHYNTFMYLISFLRELLKNTKTNGVVLGKLVLIFAGALMHARASTKDFYRASVILKYVLSCESLANITKINEV